MDIAAMQGACYPQVHPDTMAAVVRVESGGNALALNVNKLAGPRPERPVSVADAARIARLYIARGHSVDLGVGQINSANLAGLGLSIEQVLKPCTNLRAASLILSDCYARAVAAIGAEGQPALHRALACYNAGPVNFEFGFRNGYVARYVPGLKPGPAVQQVAGAGRRPQASETVRAAAAPAWGGMVDRGWGEVLTVAGFTPQ